MDCRHKVLFFDCDSTLTSIEGLDVIAHEKGIEDEISKITKLGMEGMISFKESFAMRMSKLRPSSTDIKNLSEKYIQGIRQDIKDTITQLRNDHCDVYIVSGGLRPALIEVGEYLGIPEENIFGIDVFFDSEGEYVDFDQTSILLEPKGKVKVVDRILKSLGEENIESTTFIGDGITDLETKEIVDTVVIYTNHIDRDLYCNDSNVNCTKDITSLLSLL